MANIKHIALLTESLGEVAVFYKNAFDLDMEEIRRRDNGAVFQSI